MTQQLPSDPTPKKWSWQTTVGGLVGSLGAFLAFILPWLQGSPDPRLQALGGLLVALGIGGVGVAARQNNRSDQDVGVRPPVDGVDPLAK